MIFIDPNGKWPEGIHNKIIKYAFEGILNNEQMGILKHASYNMDNSRGLKEVPYMHAMSSPGQSFADAEYKMQNFISLQKSTYVMDGNLYDLGKGMHTLMDQNSPPHEGMQTWNGDPILENNKTDFWTSENMNLLGEAARHTAFELWITPDQMYDAAQKIKSYYTFAEYERNKKYMEEQRGEKKEEDSNN